MDEQQPRCLFCINRRREHYSVETAMLTVRELAGLCVDHEQEWLRAIRAARQAASVRQEGAGG